MTSDSYRPVIIILPDAVAADLEDRSRTIVEAIIRNDAVTALCGDCGWDPAMLAAGKVVEAALTLTGPVTP